MSRANSEQEQLDIEAILGVNTSLANIAIVALHKGDTIEMLARALAGTYKTGKLPGCSVVVMEPIEEPDSLQGQAIIMKRTHTVIVEENVMLNRLQDGSGTFRSGTTADRLNKIVRQALHNRSLGNGVLMWAASEPMNDGKGVRGFEIRFEIWDDDPAETRAADPVITIASGSCTLTGGGHSGEVIRYTTDGTTPKAGGSGVQTYSAPFAVSAGTTVRAAATATSRAMSGISQQTAS